MLGHVPGDLVDALVALEEVFEVDGAVENLVQLLDVGDAFGLGDRPEFLLHQSVLSQHLVWGEVVVQRQRRPVLDALFGSSTCEVAACVVHAEGLKRPLAVHGLVDRRPGEADKHGVGNAGHEVVAQVAAGGAVSLVDQHKDVRPRVEVRGHVVELVDRRHNDAAIIVPSAAY